MKSNKQKRAELCRRTTGKAEKRASKIRLNALPWVGEIQRVNPAALAAHTSWGEPEYVRRGFYEPIHFVCKDCGVPEVWTPRQQKWWYEVAKGDAFTTATRCRACRRRERGRRALARKVHLEGLAKKGDAVS